MNKDILSALYYLVWHGGYSYNRACIFIVQYPTAIHILADAGRLEARRCFAALAHLIDVIATREKQ